MGKQIIFVLLGLILLTSLSLVNAEETIGTKEIDSCIDLIQTCADCTFVNFSSYTMPNGTRIISEVEGTKSSITFTYSSCNLTSQLGTWIIDGHGDVTGIDTVFAYTYEVTNTGNPTPEGMPMFQTGLLIIMFGTACFFLFLSIKMNETGFKIFFMLTSLIFLLATMLTGYMISMDGNVAIATNTTTLALVTVLGSILFIIFVYILIRQTVTALDLFKIKRGLAWDVGAGSKVGGFNPRKAY